MITPSVERAQFAGPSDRNQGQAADVGYHQPEQLSAAEIKKAFDQEQDQALDSIAAVHITVAAYESKQQPVPEAARSRHETTLATIKRYSQKLLRYLRTVEKQSPTDYQELATNYWWWLTVIEQSIDALDNQPLLADQTAELIGYDTMVQSLATAPIPPCLREYLAWVEHMPSIQVSTTDPHSDEPLVFSDIHHLAAQEDCLDGMYENVVDMLDRTDQRRAHFTYLIPALLIRAARFPSQDNIHRLRNACDFLVAEWEDRFSPIAWKYELLSSQAKAVVQSLRDYYDRTTTTAAPKWLSVDTVRPGALPYLNML